MTRLLTLPEAAESIGLPVTTFYKIIAEGHGPVLHPDCNRPRHVSREEPPGVGRQEGSGVTTLANFLNRSRRSYQKSPARVYPLPTPQFPTEVSRLAKAEAESVTAQGA